MLPPETPTPPETGLIDAITSALGRPQPVGWGPDPEVEDAAAAFAVRVGAVDIAVEQVVCLREAFERAVIDTAPPDEVVEGLRRLAMVTLRAIGVVVQRSITDLRSEALTDPLTDLANRRALDRDLRRELARSTRYERCFSLVLIDVDGLKAINDQHGHTTGDRVLQQLAAALAGSLRAGDGAYRIGGDEYALVLPETPAEQVDGLLGRLVEAGAPSVSWGTATCPDDGATMSALFEEADRRLYRQRARRR
jgi:diguanylate cyclase (GGDEF)-like protein